MNCAGNTLTNLDYEKTLAFAELTYEKMINSIPYEVQERAEKLLDRLTASNYGLLKKLELFYSEMDIIYGYIHRFTICKKGCNHCCSYEIAITEVEVEYIKSKIKSNKIKVDPVGTKCPFLKKGICSIYEYRPFICRRHLSINDSSRWCQSDICNNYTFPLVRLSGIDKCYAYLVGSNGINSLKDIRKAFSRPHKM